MLDPIVSLRQRVRLPPGATARLSFVTGYADSEEQARALIEKYHDRQAVARGLALAGGHSQAELRHLNLDDRQANAIQRLASRLRFADPRLRHADAIARNRQSRDALWRHGISGDLPILLVVIDQEGDHGVVREALKAHEYCRLKGFAFDLVILNEFGNGYRQEVQDQIAALIEASPSASWRDTPAGVFLTTIGRAHARRRDHAARAGAHGAGDLERIDGAPTRDAWIAAPRWPARPRARRRPTWNAAAPAGRRRRPDCRPATVLANDLGGFRPMAASTCWPSAATVRRPRRGRTCWPIRPSAAWSPKPGRGARGSTTASRAGSRRGPTIR